MLQHRNNRVWKRLAMLVVAMTLVAGAFAFQATGIARAATFQVYNQADLHDAILSANDEGTNPGQDVIELKADIDMVSCLTPVECLAPPFGPNALPPITSDIFIDGNGYTISRDLNNAGLAFFRFFFVTPSGSLTLNRVDLVGGVAGQWAPTYIARSGGAIYNYQGNVRLENQTVLALNFATRAGGAILNQGGTLEIVEDSLLILNAVVGVPDGVSGGDYFALGGAIGNDAGHVMLDDSDVLLNEVFLVDDPSPDSYAAGGGIANLTSGVIGDPDIPEVSLNNGSRVSGNGRWGLLFGSIFNTPYYGGGVYNEGGWIFVNDGSRVNQNFAMLAGGGIFNTNEAVTPGLYVKPAAQDDPPPGFVGVNGYSEVSFNSVGIHPSGDIPIEVILGADFAYGEYAWGGGIFNAGSAYVGDNSMVEGNTAIALYGAYGGGIANSGFLLNNVQSLASGFARPVDLQPGGAWVGVDNGSQVINNLAYVPGALYPYDGAPIGEANGGGIANGGNATVDVHNGSHVDYNEAYAWGGFAYGGGISSMGLRGLRPQDSGRLAATSLQEFEGTAYVNVGEGSSVDYNNAFATAFIPNAPQPKLTSAQFLGGEAYGGGIANLFSSYTNVYDQSSVDYNLASGEGLAEGGGIYNGYGGSLGRATAQQNGWCCFVDVNEYSSVDWNNVDNYPGPPPPFFGRIITDAPGFGTASPVPTGSEYDDLPYTLDDVPADWLPFGSDAQPRVVPGAGFDLQSAATSPALQPLSPDAFGGGIYNAEEGVLYTYLASVSHNGLDEQGEPQTPAAGGGIFNLGRMGLGETTVADNAAIRFGGGIFNSCSFWGEPVYPWGPCADIYRTDVTDNTVEGDGGGIYNDGLLHIEESNIARNWAGARPQGGRARPVAQVPSDQGGGGIYNSVAARFLNINNSAVYDNETAGWGGGVHNQCARLFLPPEPGLERAIAQQQEGGPCAMSENSTYSGNTAEYSGGGIYNNNGYFNLSHITVSNNTAGTVPPEASVGEAARVSAAQSGYNGSGIFNALRRPPASKPTAQGEFPWLRLANSIVYGNNGPNPSIDCGGAIFVEGNNVLGPPQINGFCSPYGPGVATLTSEDPELSPLDDNGGPTPTHEISDDGSAFNEADPDFCGYFDEFATFFQLERDQRNAPRPAQGQCDIGAYERQKERGPGEEEEPIWSIEVEPISIVDDTISWTVEVCNLATFAQSGKVRIDVDSNHLPVSTNPTGTIDSQTFWVDLPDPLAPDECLKIATVTKVASSAGLALDSARAKVAASQAKEELAQTAGTYCITGSIADVSDRDCIGQGFPTTLPDTGGSPLAQVPMALWVALTIAAIAGAGAFVLKFNKRTA